jgi:RimJ/RimL family protein N-acetyltransferase
MSPAQGEDWMDTGGLEIIETERLLLRRHRRDDYEAMAAVWRDPAVLTFFGGVRPSEEDLWARLLRYEGHWELLGYGVHALIEKATGSYLGQVGLADFHRGLGPNFDDLPEIAWVLGSETHGKGYATEGAGAALARLDALLAPPRTVCIIHPDNAGSLRVAQKLGYAPFGSTTYKNGPVTMLARIAPRA